MDEFTTKTLNSYKKIAQDPQQKSALLKDEACLGFLVYVLDDQNMTIVQNAVEILLLLSEKQSHCSALRTVCGITKAVSTIKSRDISEEFCCDVDTLLGRLNAHETKPLVDLQNSLERLHAGVKQQQTVQTAYKGNGRTENVFKKPGLKFISGGLAQRSKSMTFQLPLGCLTQSVQSLIESELLSVKGILSIYFDFPKSRCIVRSKLEVKPETVGFAIMTPEHFSVEQVIKGENGEEVHIPLCTELEHLDTDKENQVDTPDYLNESFGNSPHRDTDPTKALARPGDKAGSNDSSGGFWGNVTSFLTNSFYW